MKIRHLIIASSISIALIISDYKLNLFGSIKKAINLITIPINLIADIPSSIYEFTKNKKIITDNNQELLLLKAKLQRYNILALEKQRLINLIGNNQEIQDDNFIIARIKKINKSRLRKNIIINKGSNDNIHKNNIVLGAEGVIGTIIQSDNYYSTVRLITDPLQYTPIINLRSAEKAIAKGFAVGDDKLIINFMRIDADIKLGDIFATSGDGNLFASGYKVGKVVDITQEDQNFLTIILKPLQIIDKTIFVVVKRGSGAN